MIQDLRYAARTLAKNPTFAVMALATLALGIGANTAIFQLLDAVRLRTLPVKSPQQLVMLDLKDSSGRRGSGRSWYPALSNPIWERIRDGQQVFSGAFAWYSVGLGLGPRGQTRSVPGMLLSGDTFRVLGVAPVLGRVFTPADDKRGCGLSGAVVSYAFWQRELGGDRSAIGRRLTVEDHPVEVIGVTPPGFYGIEVGHAFDLALPLCSEQVLAGESSALDSGTTWWLTVMGRLKPGQSVAQANAQLDTASPGIFEATLPKDYPPENIKDYLKFRLTSKPAAEGVSWLRDQYGDSLTLLLGIAGLVLLIACANLASLLLARATAREREVAVRLALGASRWRILRQLMVESLVLAVAGGGLGLLVAGMLSQFLVSLLATQGDTLFLDLALDWRVLGFTAATTALTCILFGLTPALRATRVAPGEAMKAAGRGLTSSRERFGLRRALAASQVSLSLVLLAGALLFARSLYKLLSQNMGFRQDGILVTEADFTKLALPVERRLDFKRQLLERLRAVPGVEAVAEAGIIPLSGSATDNIVWQEGSDLAHGKTSNFGWISHDYFKALDMTLLAGRDFDERDSPASPKVAIVNQAFARRLGLGANPVGSRFRRQTTPTEPEATFEIVGLVQDSKYRDIRQGFPPIVFLSTSQAPKPGTDDQIIVRSSLPTPDVTRQVRKAIAEVSPLIDTDFWTMRTMIHDKALPERLMATLSGLFGLLAALLTSVGLYGVMSFLVVSRTSEIGIRMALGAGRSEILKMVLGQAGTLVGAGLAVGVALALAAARTARSLLFELRPEDPLAFALAALLLAIVAAAACYWPARRASKLDPMEALRYE